jgi:putative phosphoribosyl transferase
LLPSNAIGIVIFAHGSGSSRLSPRNRLVARWLNERGCGTLLFDLLTDEEARDRRNVFDIDLLAARMRSATDWLRRQQGASLPIGYFGASTGAAAALVAAAGARDAIAAVVSRGGRPDLAGNALPRVTAPTLLIVGSLDHEVIELNQQAQRQMAAATETRLEIVPGATHLFEEPGTLEEVGRLAGNWFIDKFAAHSKRSIVVTQPAAM